MDHLPGVDFNGIKFKNVVAFFSVLRETHVLLAHTQDLVQRIICGLTKRKFAMGVSIRTMGRQRSELVKLRARIEQRLLLQDCAWRQGPRQASLAEVQAAPKLIEL